MARTITTKATLKGHEFKMVEKTHFGRNEEYEADERRTEYTTIYKDGSFWGKRTIVKKGRNTEISEDYELTVGDSKNFCTVAHAIWEAAGGGQI